MSDALILDRRIVWDCNNKKEVEEAKKIILNFKKSGHKILLSNGNLMKYFRPSYEEVVIKAEKLFKSIMKILNDTGDERLVWDSNDGKEALQAKERFKKLIDQGYTAFSVNSKGDKKNRITEFDVEAEEIIMVPKTVKG